MDKNKKEIWTMGSYAMLNMSIMVGLMYLNTFATEILLIPTSVLASALLIAKSIDFVISLFAGAIIEKVKLGNMGKYSSWLYYGRWILAVSVMLEVCNTSAAPMVVRIAVMSVAYTFLNSMMNLVQTAYYGMVTVVAGPDSQKRSDMTINMTRQSTVVSLICASIPTLVTIMPFGNWNYFFIATIFMIPMPIALGNIAKLGEGRDKPLEKGQGSGVKLSDMINTLVKNPMMLALFISFTLYYTAYYIFMSNYTYYFLYVAKDFTKLTICNLVGSCVGFCGSLVMPIVGQKIGKKWAVVIGFILSMAGLTGICFFASKHWIYYLLFNAVSLIGQYTWTPYMVTMYLDCGEYYLYNTGKDTRSIAAGLATPPMKMGITVGGSIGLFLLNATGFVAGFTPTPEWTSAFMKVSFLLPGVIYGLASIVMAMFYKINDKDARMYSIKNYEKMVELQHLDSIKK